MKRSQLLAFAMLMSLSVLSSCVNNKVDEEYIKAVKQWRSDTKEYLTATSNPPVIAAKDSIILNYYDIDAAYRVTAKIVKNRKYETTAITETDGNKIIYAIYGLLEFEIKEEKLSLTLFQDVDHAGHFLLSFKDLTSGLETYGAGRMIPIELIGDQSTVEIDFNRAYNPYCAYNEAYICPMAPMQNRLKVKIEAGEKIPSNNNH